MPTNKITIHEDLLRLKPFDALESVPMSKLARKGTSVLQQIISTAQAVVVKIQGQGAMVTISQRQYDEMLELIQAVHEENSEDGFIHSLNQQFDELMSKMDQPDAAQATESVLFGDSDALNKAYRPGATEVKA